MARLLALLALAGLPSALAARASTAQATAAHVAEGEAESLGERSTVSSLALQTFMLQRARLRAGSQATLSSEMRMMTLQRALDIVKPHAPPGLQSFLQTLGGVHRTLRYDTQNAGATLNQLAVQARRKLDLEEVQCSEYELKQVSLMEESRREQDDYASQGAAARARILGAQATIGRSKRAMATVEEVMDRNRRKCEADVQVIRQQLSDAEEDIATMTDVVGKTDCSSLKGLLLSQCREGPQKLRGRALVRRALLQTAHRHAARRSFLQALSATKRLARFANLTHNERPFCAARKAPTCGNVEDRMLMIQTGMLDKRDEMREQLATIQSDCTSAEAKFKQEISNVEFRLREAQTTLAESISIETQTQEQGRMKILQVRDLAKDHSLTMRQCKTNLAAFEHEICGIKRIRSELHAMSNGEREYIQDCEVSEWTPEECSATCGGGSQTLRRTVVSVPTAGGAGCPPLEMIRRCGDRKCPQDCRVGEWSRWSSCTARCGGGVRQRSRSVQRPSLHGGRSCGETAQVEACNLQACSRDCELADWSEWSFCSKMCNSGLKQRIKIRELHETGDGICADPKSEERLEYEACNSEACKKPEGQETLRCDAATDVVILMQGSSSLEESGWKAIKKAGERLVKAFAGSNSRVGVVLFSGPRNMKTFLQCSRGAQIGEKAPDMTNDCNIRWVSRLSSDIDAVASKVAGLSYPKGTTLTSAALTATVPELRGGRLEARSAVIVLTNGRPMSPRLTKQAAALVRARARLMWVPVTTHAPLQELKNWASSPAHENVINIKGFDELEKPEAVDAIISSICPKVK